MGTELAFGAQDKTAPVTEQGTGTRAGGIADWTSPPVPETEPPLDPLGQIRALARTLERRGFTAEVQPARGEMREHPCLKVRTGPGRHAIAVERVYAAPTGADGAWQFLWHHLEPIAPLAAVDEAAAAISRLIGCSGTAGPSACPECAEIKRKTE